MDRRLALKSLAALALCPICSSASRAAEAAHWSYEGATGADRWSELDAANRVCSAGMRQSPIDIADTVAAELPQLKFDWSKTPDTIVNNGHTVQVNFTWGGTLAVGKESYELLQFHFHRPSEHLIGSEGFPMEVHFVHKGGAGGLAVVGVLIAAGEQNPVFARLISTMPLKAGPAVKADPGIDPFGLLPAGRGYYFYPGSLTTPPCAETVDWMVLTNPIEVSEADIGAFAKLYPNNSRPVQAGNRRSVLRSE
jgi:carbonic anhydrase